MLAFKFVDVGQTVYRVLSTQLVWCDVQTVDVTGSVGPRFESLFGAHEIAKSYLKCRFAHERQLSVEFMIHPRHWKYGLDC